MAGHSIPIDFRVAAERIADTGVCIICMYDNYMRNGILKYI